MKTPTGHLYNHITTGSVSELVAAADLMRRGCDVFRQLSYTMSCDLVAQLNGELLRVEVRTGRRTASGKVYCGRQGKGCYDILAIVIGNEVIYEGLPADWKRES
jgi:hypothetical protein